ncbi:hypothetical protein BKA64DRAFT_704627 [Cadophora sp. MPI-SDFR-AT-0126]|nr:hypothetical protein BKA64DRAFT_704627 [Leotiomycetes sp. MPI-SDFR-AT-0126]
MEETDPVKTDPSLDMYNPANKVPYSREFTARYRAAQRDRNYRITAWVKKELQRLNAAGIPDRNFPLYRTMADLRFNDSTLDPSDRLTPACYTGEPAAANRAISLLGRSSTLLVQGTEDVSVFPSDARGIFDLIASEDKELRMIPGGHFLNGSQAELDLVIGIICEWVGKRI